VSLVPRHLECHGIATLCPVSARDLFAAGRPPRAAFVDYPLGHSAGKPGDVVDQLNVVRSALAGFSSLTEPGQMLELDNQWGSDEWRAEAGANRGEDTRQPRDDSPQFQLPADREAALASGAL